MPTPAEISDSDFSVIMTQRLYLSICNASVGAVKSWLDAHGPDRNALGSVGKRVAKQVCAVLRNHPDCRVVSTREAFEPELERLREEVSRQRARIARDEAIVAAAHAWKDAKLEFEAHLLSPKRDEARFIAAGKSIHVAEANLLAALPAPGAGTGV